MFGFLESETVVAQVDPGLVHVVWGLILCIWIGGLAMLTFIVGPVVFNVIDSKAKAGMVLTRIFTIWRYIECLFAMVLILIGAWVTQWENRPMDPFQRMAPLAGATVLAIVTAVNQMFIVRALLDARAAAGDMDKPSTTPEEEQARSSFRFLHGFSMILSLLTLGAALFLMVTDSLEPFHK